MPFLSNGIPPLNNLHICLFGRVETSKFYYQMPANNKYFFFVIRDLSIQTSLTR